MLGPRPLILVLGACAADPEPLPGTRPSVPLVATEAWVLLDPGEAPMDLDGAPCGPLDFGAEPGGFEVRTEACDGATFGQPLLADLRPGDRVAVGLSHLDLWSPEEGAVAELVLGVGPRAVWRAALPVPSPAGVIAEEVPFEAYAEPGDLAWFAVRNHGSNSYVLTYVERRGPEVR